MRTLESRNPYSPPEASLEHEDQLGEIVRDGGLVRLDRQGRLPDRCIICNEPAAGGRVVRKSYYSRLAWRFAAFLIPLMLIGLGVFTNFHALDAFFWPSVLLLYLIHVFVRKRVRIDYSLCGAHRRLHRSLLGVSIVSLLAVFVPLAELIRTGRSTASLALFSMIVIMLLVEMGRRYAGPARVRPAKVDSRHLWLRGTGKAFRESL